MFIIALVDIFLIQYFHTPLNPVFIDIFFSTNANEAKEFFGFYSDKIIEAITPFCIIGAILILYPYAKFYTKFVPKLTLPQKYISFGRIFTLCVCIICTIMVGLKTYRLKENRLPYLSKNNAFIRWGDTLANALHTHSHIAQYKTLSKDYDTFLKNVPYPVSASYLIPNVVLILGESTQRNYMSLYGYPLPTNPFLSALQKSENLVVFSDVIAPSSSTNTALENVLTFRHYENAQTPWFRQQNIIDILNLAGYKTFWLSNQEVMSLYGNVPEIISRRADVTRFSTMSDSYNVGAAYDEIVLKLLDDVRGQESKNKDSKQEHTQNTSLEALQESSYHFYLFHLMGSHSTYKSRYPQSFERFSPQDLVNAHLNTLTPYPHTSSTLLSKKQLQTKVEYLNTLLYNDYVVNEIIERFKDSNSLVIYVGDHGDEVYDFRDFAGHSIISRFVAEIPFMIYMSDSFKAHYPNLVQKIQEAKDKPFMSDDLIHALLDLLGITTSDFIQSRSLFSSHYNDKRARIFVGVDYDRDLKTIQEQTNGGGGGYKQITE